MRTSYLPKKLAAIIVFLISALSIPSACTSKKTLVSPARSTAPERRATFVTNINTASEAELERLPQLGPSLAQKIVEHRRRYGPFRKREHILIVEGISESRFRQFEPFIDIE